MLVPARGLADYCILQPSPSRQQWASTQRQPAPGADMCACMQETDNPDLRDRVYMYWRLSGSLPDSPAHEA